MNRSGPGFGYGFLVAFCFTLSIFCLLCGLVLQGFQKVVSESLESCECSCQAPSGKDVPAVPLRSRRCVAALLLSPHGRH